MGLKTVSEGLKMGLKTVSEGLKIGLKTCKKIGLNFWSEFLNKEKQIET